jgi:hypothetical protein
MNPDLKASGAQLGSYILLERLGAGGMGEVYRARDTTLEREVALKLLPEELTDDPERRARLLAEARAAASLNHPNICTIYEVGEASGRAHVAMEVVEGRPLSGVVAHGPLPLAHVVRYGIQLADARSDVWALGVVLYEMTAGVCPFAGRTSFELSSTILRDAPPPLPSRVPASLQSAILRCLEKEPGHRYQVTAQLVDAESGAVWVSFYARRHEESVTRAETLREVWPANVMAPVFLANHYAVMHRKDETTAECDRVMEQVGDVYVPRVIGQCVWALAAVGRTDQARHLLQRLEAPPPGMWVDPALMAQASVGLGEIDHAIQWSQKGIDERSPTMIYLKAGPQFDPVRADPRFQKLLHQMNFPP